MCLTTVKFGGLEWNLPSQLNETLVQLYCRNVASSCNGSTESENVHTIFENVHTKLIMYRHYVHTLLNPYFKLCMVQLALVACIVPS